MQEHLKNIVNNQNSFIEEIVKTKGFVVSLLKDHNISYNINDFFAPKGIHLDIYKMFILEIAVKRELLSDENLKVIVGLSSIFKTSLSNSKINIALEHLRIELNDRGLKPYHYDEINLYGTKNNILLKKKTLKELNEEKELRKDTYSNEDEDIFFEEDDEDDYETKTFEKLNEDTETQNELTSETIEFKPLVKIFGMTEREINELYVKIDEKYYKREETILLDDNMGEVLDGIEIKSSISQKEKIILENPLLNTKIGQIRSNVLGDKTLSKKIIKNLLIDENSYSKLYAIYSNEDIFNLLKGSFTSDIAKEITQNQDNWKMAQYEKEQLYKHLGILIDVMGDSKEMMKREKEITYQYGFPIEISKQILNLTLQLDPNKKGESQEGYQDYLNLINNLKNHQKEIVNETLNNPLRVSWTQDLEKLINYKIRLCLINALEVATLSRQEVEVVRKELSESFNNSQILLEKHINNPLTYNLNTLTIVNLPFYDESISIFNADHSNLFKDIFLNKINEPHIFISTKDTPFIQKVNHVKEANINYYNSRLVYASTNYLTLKECADIGYFGGMPKEYSFSPDNGRSEEIKRLTDFEIQVLVKAYANSTDQTKNLKVKRNSEITKVIKDLILAQSGLRLNTLLDIDLAEKIIFEKANIIKNKYVFQRNQLLNEELNNNLKTLVGYREKTNLLTEIPKEENTSQRRKELFDTLEKKYNEEYVFEGRMKILAENILEPMPKQNEKLEIDEERVRYYIDSTNEETLIVIKSLNLLINAYKKDSNKKGLIPLLANMTKVFLTSFTREMSYLENLKVTTKADMYTDCLIAVKNVREYDKYSWFNNDVNIQRLLEVNLFDKYMLGAVDSSPEYKNFQEIKLSLSEEYANIFGKEQSEIANSFLQLLFSNKRENKKFARIELFSSMLNILNPELIVKPILALIKEVGIEKTLAVIDYSKLSFVEEKPLFLRMINEELEKVLKDGDLDFLNMRKEFYSNDNRKEFKEKYIKKLGTYLSEIDGMEENELLSMLKISEINLQKDIINNDLLKSRLLLKNKNKNNQKDNNKYLPIYSLYSEEQMVELLLLKNDAKALIRTRMDFNDIVEQEIGLKNNKNINDETLNKSIIDVWEKRIETNRLVMGILENNSHINVQNSLKINTLSIIDDIWHKLDNTSPEYNEIKNELSIIYSYDAVKVNPLLICSDEELCLSKLILERDSKNHVLTNNAQEFLDFIITTLKKQDVNAFLAIYPMVKDLLRIEVNIISDDKLLPVNLLILDLLNDEMIYHMLCKQDSSLLKKLKIEKLHQLNLSHLLDRMLNEKQIYGINEVFELIELQNRYITDFADHVRYQNKIGEDDFTLLRKEVSLLNTEEQNSLLGYIRPFIQEVLEAENTPIITTGNMLDILKDVKRLAQDKNGKDMDLYQYRGHLELIEQKLSYYLRDKLSNIYDQGYSHNFITDVMKTRFIKNKREKDFNYNLSESNLFSHKKTPHVSYECKEKIIFELSTFFKELDNSQEINTESIRMMFFLSSEGKDVPLCQKNYDLIKRYDEVRDKEDPITYALFHLGFTKNISSLLSFENEIPEITKIVDKLRDNNGDIVSMTYQVKHMIEKTNFEKLMDGINQLNDKFDCDELIKTIIAESLGSLVYGNFSSISEYDMSRINSVEHEDVQLLKDIILNNANKLFKKLDETELFDFSIVKTFYGHKLQDLEHYAAYRNKMLDKPLTEIIFENHFTNKYIDLYQKELHDSEVLNDILIDKMAHGRVDEISLFFKKYKYIKKLNNEYEVSSKITTFVDTLVREDQLKIYAENNRVSSVEKITGRFGENKLIDELSSFEREYNLNLVMKTDVKKIKKSKKI